MIFIKYNNGGYINLSNVVKITDLRNDITWSRNHLQFEFEKQHIEFFSCRTSENLDIVINIIKSITELNKPGFYDINSINDKISCRNYSLDFIKEY